MRESLKKLNGERKTFIGTFEQYSSRKYSVAYRKTALIKNIKDINGKFISDHAWVACNENFNDIGNLTKGDVIQFNAKIKEYIKGYWDLREEINIIKPYEKDYKFDELKKVRIIKAAKCHEN